jgi:hypothetical protein
MCIRDGISVCGLQVHPSRLKHKPMQCMKCRHWGHFAHTCTAATGTCGTCGGEHRTNECTSRGKVYCVACRSDAHASWDRDCPEFRRRCEQFDENYPENSLPYFPTEEDWTLTPRPSKLQHSDKFPEKYVVAPLCQPEQPNQAHAAKPQGRQRRQQTHKVPANQSTMDSFIIPGSTQRSEPGKTSNNQNADTAAPPSQTPLSYPPETGPEPRGWD